VRWTIGDVSPRGFEALRLSAWGIRNLLGASADYLVCVNTVGIERARELSGELPPELEWYEARGTEIPRFLAEQLDQRMAEGVAWKFAPLRAFPDRYELALDNDCILWRLPQALSEWLDSGDLDLCVIAEDVRPCLGQFERVCGALARNTGIRGLPPGFDLESALDKTLRTHPVKLVSELDEQGLQVAAVSSRRTPSVVSVEEVTICSPFPPHRQELGSCGAHFVGLNSHGLPWSYDGVPASELTRGHFDRLKGEVALRVGAPGAHGAFAPPDANRRPEQP
jgi:hypothetical protein